MSILSSGERITKIMDSEGNVLADMTQQGGASSNTIGGNLPLVFESDGSDLTDYTIHGNIGGVGNYNSTTRKYDIPVTVTSDNLLESNCQSETYNGLTVTVNADKSITVNGTATATTTFAIHNGSHTPTTTAQEIENGTYYLSGVPEGGETGTYTMSYRYTPASGGSSQVGRIPVEGIVLDNTSGTYRYLSVYIAVWQGVTVNSVTFLPSLQKVNTVTLSANAPMGLDDVLSLADTGVDIPTYNGMNTLTFGTTVQPKKVCLTGNVSYVSDGYHVSFDSLRSSTTMIDLSNMTEIPDECCVNMNNLAYVLISSRLTRIGDRAFYGQKNSLFLNTTTDAFSWGYWDLPSSLTYIGDEAFWNTYCGYGTGIGRITHFGHRSFYNSNCDVADIHADYIGDEAFYTSSSYGNCTITITSTATYIGHKAFYGAYDPHVSFPNTPVNIMPDAFEGVEGIQLSGTLWNDFDIDNFDLSGYASSSSYAGDFTTPIISKLRDRTGLAAYTLILSAGIDSSCLAEIAAAASAKNWNIATR